MWVKHSFGYLVYRIFLWPEFWRGCLHIYLLSFPRYWTVLIFILIFFEWLNTENQQYVSSRQRYPTFEGQNLKSANSTHSSTFYSVIWFVFRHCQHHYVLDSVLCKLNTTRGLDPNPTLALGLTHKIHRDGSARSEQNRQWRPQQVSSMDRKCSSPKIIYINKINRMA